MMKSTTFLFSVLLVIGSSAHASKCIDKAVSVAMENSHQAIPQLQFIEILPSKSYLEAFSVTLRDERNSSDVEVIKVTLMKSECSIISVIPDIGQN
jgi:DNA polymerase III alpha subunit (gram-positive type)